MKVSYIERNFFFGWVKGGGYDVGIFKPEYLLPIPWNFSSEAGEEEWIGVCAYWSFCWVSGNGEGRKVWRKRDGWLACYL